MPRSCDAAQANVESTAPEDRLAAPREEIRRAGKGAVWNNVSLAASSGSMVMSSVMLAGSLIGWRPSTSILAVALFVTPVVTVPLLLSLQRHLFRRRARSVLAPLAPSERSALLLPLRSDEDSGVRWLVRPLLRELTASAELTPAATPEGGGTEVSGGVE